MKRTKNTFSPNTINRTTVGWRRNGPTLGGGYYLFFSNPHAKIAINYGRCTEFTIAFNLLHYTLRVFKLSSFGALFSLHSLSSLSLCIYTFPYNPFVRSYHNCHKFKEDIFSGVRNFLVLTNSSRYIIIRLRRKANSTCAKTRRI